MTISANLIIIGITSLISIASFSNENLLGKLLHRPYLEDRNKEYFRMLTSGFIHADMFHLFINMFVLYQFGPWVEMKFIEKFGSIGSITYVIFYILTIVLANVSTHFRHRSNYSYAALGASGATSGVLFSFIFFEPLSTLGLYMIIPVQVILFGVLYLWYSSWAAKKNMDNIGHDAHFYGAVAGFAITMILFSGEIGSFFSKLINVF
jgi:membrane associated rhomboid family serine protease